MAGKFPDAPTSYQARLYLASGAMIMVSALTIPELWAAADAAVGQRVNDWWPSEFERPAA